jgi:hypothetical protein
MPSPFPGETAEYRTRRNELFAPGTKSLAICCDAPSGALDGMLADVFVPLVCPRASSPLTPV